jgi:hypothetical protein
MAGIGLGEDISDFKPRIVEKDGMAFNWLKIFNTAI